MRPLAWLLAFGMCLGVAGTAAAGMKITERTANYAIAGRTGYALLDAMDHRGPKHGLLTRAIAQTRYTISWRIEWGETSQACRIKDLDGHLAITYTYPRVSGKMSPELSRKWETFYAGVRKHEEMHGRIARQMAAAAEKSVGRLTVRNDPGCRKARREAKRKMDAVYAEYEARQLAFDAREHREGGHVESLIHQLTRRR